MYEYYKSLDGIRDDLSTIKVLVLEMITNVKILTVLEMITNVCKNLDGIRDDN